MLDRTIISSAPPPFYSPPLPLLHAIPSLLISSPSFAVVLFLFLPCYILLLLSPSSWSLPPLYPPDSSSSSAQAKETPRWVIYCFRRERTVCLTFVPVSLRGLQGSRLNVIFYQWNIFLSSFSAIHWLQGPHYVISSQRNIWSLLSAININELKTWPRIGSEEDRSNERKHFYFDGTRLTGSPCRTMYI